MKTQDKRTTAPKKKSPERKGGVTLSSPAKDPGLTNSQAMLVVATGLAFGIGVISQWEPLNGVIEWTGFEWPWRDLGVLRTASIMFAPLVAISWALWRAEKGELPAPWRLLAVLALSNYSLQLLAMVSDPRGLGFVQTIVASPSTTSYFADATEIQGSLIAWLREFHRTPLYLHSATHPAGPILYYYFFYKLFGPATGAMLGGCCVGLLGSAGVFVVYRFAGLWTAEQKPRIVASALYALLPSLTVFFPEFDQVYPILSMLLLLQWVEALTKPERWLPRALALGMLLALSAFFAYNLLSTGAFLVYSALYRLWMEGWRRPAWRTLVRSSSVALATCGGVYLALWFATGYNAPAAFRQALSNQSQTASLLKRPYAAFVLLDPYDFLLGAGMLALPLVVFHVRGVFRKFDVRQASSVFTLIGLGTILTIDISGLLRAETARVWLFLQPLLIVPAAIELSRVRWPWRLSIFAVQWWIVACLKAKMNFLDV